MAIGDTIFSYGKPERVLSSGVSTTVSVYFIYGKPVIFHEYISGTPPTGIAFGGLYGKAFSGSLGGRGI